MADSVQESILNAIDTLVSNRIDKIQADKTVTAKIVNCTNSLTNEYKVSYNGGYMYAYAQEGASYTSNVSVYVLVPQGDFTKQKTIVGKAQNIEDDQNISFVSSALSDYNLIGKNCVTDTKGAQPGKLNSYKKESYVLFYQYGLNDPNGTYVGINIDELNNNLREAEAVLLEASFKTRLPSDHKLSKNGNYGLQFVLAFSDRDNLDDNGEPTIKKLSYTLDSDSMTGNPFNYSSWYDNYNIFSIDLDNFLYMDSILGYAKDFVDKTDTINADLWGNDIFIQDVEFYGLKKITATNGEYKLAISTPLGSTFKSILEKDTLSIIGKVTKSQTNLSDYTTFYWFAQDGRITTTSENYQMYGGTGWRLLKDKGYSYQCVLKASENKAYENKYLCVAVYHDSVILKENITIYNDAAKRDLSISSNLGTKFSFDRGAPTLTCLVDEKASDFETGQVNAHKDSWFRFVWSKIDSNGSTILFNTTQEELKKAYNDAVKAEAGYATLSALKSQIEEFEGVSWDGNVLTYPVRQIDSSATFNCAVYLRDRDLTGQETAEDIEYSIGSAEITLQNEGVASPTDYYITIENGDQVFQYSESGVAPDDERYEDPLEILPLTCHFFDPAGLEVNSGTYTIKWRVPLTDTMIIAPKDGMVLNSATNKIEWCTSETYPTAIADDYNYQALSNQVTAIVTYQGEEYTKDTTFLFTKVGENGTNGTDIVAKISPVSTINLLDNEFLQLKLKDNEPLVVRNSSGTTTETPWNTGQSLADQVLKFNLYQRNEKLSTTDSKVNWSMLCGNNSKSKYMSVDSGTVSWDTEDAMARTFRNQIVKASLSWESGQYYACYPVPVVNYHTKTDGSIVDYRVKVSSKYTLKSIMYNADGRNPLYNKNQGVGVYFDNDVLEASEITEELSEYAVQVSDIWTNAEYSYEEKQAKAQALLKSLQNEIDSSELSDLNSFIKGLEGIKGKFFVWNAEGGEVSAESYTTNAGKRSTGYGEHPNNPDFKITEEKNSSNGELTLSGYNMPMVYILPNDACTGAYGNNLVRLRIFSSEKAAGKNTQGQFTGNPEVEVYIPIYMSLNTFGLASLNAWDGNHIEINEDDNYILAPQIGAGQKDSNNRFTGVVMGTAQNYDTVDSSGKIKENDSSVGLLGYSHGKQSIYLDAETGNATFGLPEQQASQGNAFEEGRIKLVPGGESYIGNWRIGSRALYNIAAPETEDGVFQEAKTGKPYTNYPVEDSQFSIPPESQGMILGANPAYLSVKGKPLTEHNSNIEWNAANTTIVEGDSLEVEIDPRKSSTFSIYRHTDWDSDIKKHTKVWRRYPLVGINQNGQFYTNAIEDGDSTMGIGKVGAFQDSAANDRYVGAQFGWKKKINLFKFYVDTKDSSSNTTRDLYISTGTKVTTYQPDGVTVKSTGNEYARGLKLYGKTVTLYAPTTGKTDSPQSIHRISVSSTNSFFGHEGVGYLEISTNPKTDSSLLLSNNLVVTNNSINSDKGLKINTCYLSVTQNGGNLTLTGSNKISVTNSDSAIVNIGKDLNIYTKGSSKQFRLQTSSANNYLLLGTDTSTTGDNATGNKRSYIQLYNKNDTKSQLISDSGWNMQTKAKGITITSSGTSEGIILQATPPNGKSSQGITFSMTPQDGGSASDFYLHSPNGTIKSTYNLNGSNQSGVQITSGIATKWQYITSTISGTECSLITSGQIQASGDIIASGSKWVYGGGFGFNDWRTYNAGSYGDYGSNSISSHLSHIYSMIKDVRNRADNAQSSANDAWNYADSAMTEAKSAATAASHANSNANNRVDWSSYNRHTHRTTTSYGYYSVNAMNMRAQDLHELITTTPL